MLSGRRRDAILERIGEWIEVFLTSMIDRYGEQTVEVFLLGVMSFVFFGGGYLIWNEQRSVLKKGRHTTGEIVELRDYGSFFTFMPVIKFEMDGKVVFRKCSRSVRLKKADYPIGTVVKIAYLHKRPFGLKTTLIYIENEELRYKQGYLAGIVMCGFGVVMLGFLIAAAMR